MTFNLLDDGVKGEQNHVDRITAMSLWTNWGSHNLFPQSPTALGLKHRKKLNSDCMIRAWYNLSCSTLQERKTLGQPFSTGTIYSSFLGSPHTCKRVHKGKNKRCTTQVEPLMVELHAGLGKGNVRTAGKQYCHTNDSTETERASFSLGK